MKTSSSRQPLHSFFILDDTFPCHEWKLFLFTISLPSSSPQQVCRAVDSLPDGADPVARVFAGVSVFYNFTGTEKCFDAHADPHGENGWQFQVGGCARGVGVEESCVCGHSALPL